MGKNGSPKVNDKTGKPAMLWVKYEEKKHNYAAQSA